MWIIYRGLRTRTCSLVRREEYFLKMCSKNAKASSVRSKGAKAQKGVPMCLHNADMCALDSHFDLASLKVIHHALKFKKTKSSFPHQPNYLRV